MQDYSSYPINTEVFFTGAEKKYELMVDGYRYIMKFRKNSEIGLLYNHVSEYLGSHVFALSGIPVQETYLGTYQGQEVVLMKNFCQEHEVLVPFNEVGESTLERDKELYQYTYEDIQRMLRENAKSANVPETIERFWDMFIIDALNGNFDRHGGNWGFIKRENRYYIAPVYDNGSSMYPRLNSDEAIEKVLRSKEALHDRIFRFPTSQVKLNGRKSSYSEVIGSLRYEACNEALCRLVPGIDLSQINDLIEKIEGLSPVRIKFYQTMYRLRFEEILLPAFQRIRGS